MRHCKSLVPLIRTMLLWAEMAEAFCFSFGSGNNRRADYYHNPFPAPGFPARGYPAYPAYPATPPVQGWYGGPPVFGFPRVPANYPGGYVPLKQQ